MQITKYTEFFLLFSFLLNKKTKKRRKYKKKNTESDFILSPKCVFETNRTEIDLKEQPRKKEKNNNVKQSPKSD